MLDDLAVADTNCVACLGARPSACTRHAQTHKRADVGFEGLSGMRMLDQSSTEFDAVDGAHSEASECQRVAALKQTTMRGAVHG